MSTFTLKNPLSVVDPTATTSPSTGAIVTTGGLGVASNISIGGKVSLFGSSSGFAALQAPAAANNVTFVLPGSLPSVNPSYLISDTAGNLSFTEQGGGGGGGGTAAFTTFTFLGNNNQSTPANVTGMVYTTGSFEINVSVDINATTDLTQFFKLSGILSSTSGWNLLTLGETGDVSGVLFTITPSGQLQYTSANYPGFVSLTISWSDYLPVGTNLNLVSGSNTSGAISQTGGTLFSVNGSTVLDTDTAASGTLGVYSSSYMGVSTLTALNTNVKTTTANTLYIAGPPVSGTNETILNPYSLNIATGNMYMGGEIRFFGGASYTALRGSNAANNIALTLPKSLPTTNESFIVSDTLGNLSFSTSITPSLTSFSGANNQAAPANIPGMNFSSGLFEINVSVGVIATTNLTQFVKLSGILSSTSGWNLLTIGQTGDISGVIFTITSTGQIQYTSANYPGFVSLTISWSNYSAVGAVTNVVSGANTSGTISTSSGTLFNVNGSAVVDTGTAPSGTLSNFYGSYIGIPNLSALNTGVTTTNASTLYIAGAPTGGTNETISNAYSLRIASGDTYFGGDLTVASTLQLPTNSNTVNATSGALTVQGDIHLYNGTKNTIVFGTPGSGTPTFTNRSVGTKIVLWPGVSASNVDHAIGVEANASWYSVPNSSGTHNFYCGTTISAQIGNGSVTSTGYLRANFGGNLTNTQLRISPSSSGGQSSIQFSVGPSETGAWWVAGHNVGTVGNDAFSIWSSTLGATLINIYNTGAVHIPSALQLATNSNTVSYLTGGLSVNGDFHLSNATKNTIVFNSAGQAAPSYTNRSIGTKIVLWPNITASTADWAIGIEPSATWYSVSATTHLHKFYCGTTLNATIGNGIVTFGGPGSHYDLLRLLPSTNGSQTAVNYHVNSNGGGAFWTTGTNVGSIGADTYCIYSTTRGGNVINFYNTGVVNVPSTIQLANTSNSVTSTSGSLTVNGDIHLYNATKNTIVFNSVGIAPPSYVNRSVGTKIVLYPGITASFADHAIGVDSGTMWYSVSQTANVHQFYCGTTLSAQIGNGFTQIGGVGSDVNVLRIAPPSNGLQSAINFWANSNFTGGNWAVGHGVASSGSDTFSIWNSTYNGLMMVMYNNGRVSIAPSTASTNTTTGALTVGGGVGIGGNLNVSGNMGFANASQNGTIQFSNADIPRRIVFWESGNNNHQVAAIGKDVATMRFQSPVTTDDFVYYAGTSSTTSTELFRIKGTGVVNIGGSVNIGGNLAIGGASSNAHIQLPDTIVNRKIVLWGQSGDHNFYGFGINGGALRYQVSTTSDAHVFYAGASATTSNEIFRIKGNGSIQIPNSSGGPVTDGVSGGTKILMGPLSYGGSYPHSIGSDGVGTFWFACSDRYFQWYVSYVGLAMQLSNNSLLIGGTLSQNYNFSDIRLKDNVKTISSINALNIILKLRPVTFDWKKDHHFKDVRGKNERGFIAQEVEKILPDLIEEEKALNTEIIYKTIRHEKFTPYVVSAIHELNSKINTLETALEAQKMHYNSEIDKLKAFINSKFPGETSL